MTKEEDEIIKLRQKLLDMEAILYNIEIINNLFTPFANENSPEGAIVAELISKELDEANETIYTD